jgi:O-methyltransferase involved in polyketide biosynthesis
VKSVRTARVKLKLTRPQDPTAAVRSTDEDAAVSRLSCAELGYINDPFARLFVKRPCPRPPLINVGTHARTWAMDKLVRDFMKSNPSRPKQVLSLGAGTDTRFFKLGRLDAGDWKPTRYVEIDYPESTSKKASILKRNPAFAEALGQDVRLGRSVRFGGYSIKIACSTRRNSLSLCRLQLVTWRLGATT